MCALIEEESRVRRSSATKYEEWKTFQDEESFAVWFTKEKVNWKINRSRDLDKNRTDEYRCCFAQRVNYQCSMKMRILRPHDAEKIIVQKSQGQHTHKPTNEIPLSPAVKGFIGQNLTSPPLIIQDKLQAQRRGKKNAAPLPKKKQPALYQDAYVMFKEGKKTLTLLGTDIHILPLLDTPIEELKVMYNELVTCSFNSWKRYKQIRKASTSFVHPFAGRGTTNAIAMKVERRDCASTL